MYYARPQWSQTRDSAPTELRVEMLRDNLWMERQMIAGGADGKSQLRAGQSPNWGML